MVVLRRSVASLVTALLMLILPVVIAPRTGLAILLAQSIGEQMADASDFLTEGLHHRSLLRFNDALNSFERALSIYQAIQSASRVPDRTRQIARRGEADTLRERGRLLIELDDYEAGLADYNQSLAIYRELENKAYEATTLNSLGVDQYTQRKYTQARESFEQSLEIHRQIPNNPIYQQASLLNNIALTYQAEEDYNNASITYERSLEIYESCLPLPKCEEGIGNVFSNIASFYNETGNHDSAIFIYQRLFPIASSTLQFDILYSLSTIFYNQGTDALEALEEDSEEYYLQALVYFQESLASIRKEVSNRDKRVDEALALNSIGILLNHLDETELSIIFLKQTVNVYESIRADNRDLSEDLQESYFTKFDDAYRLLAELLLKHDRILEAQHVLDLLKEQELNNYLRGVRSSDSAREGTELVLAETIIVSAHNTLIDQIIANGKRLSELEAKPTLTDAESNELVGLQAEQRQILQDFNAFKDSEIVRTQVALLSPQERSQTIPIEQLPALQDNLSEIPQGAVLLYPFILDNSLELIVTSPYSPPVRHTVNVSHLEINDAVQAFRYALEEPTRDALTPAQTLYNWLIAPIEADLKAARVNTIIYAPDRSLRYIPLAALHDGEQWLAERYRINHITAASLTDLNTPPRSTPSLLAGALTEGPLTVSVGDNQYRFNLLEHVDDEVNHIAELFPGSTPLLDTDFNRTRIERDANCHSILHLATHAKFLIGQPEDSFILFSDQERWTLQDFKEGLLNLTRVDLVVLSACETGVDNTFGNGEEILGFGYLMQTAGARASMASLWAVDDGGTQILMTEFYDGLVRGNLGKAEALQQAQMALIRLGEERDRGGLELANAIGLDPNDLSHPHYWAPFILIGNGL
ncbi:MAG: CHAT domain-containing protein [Cyanobacteria bacterium P01_D01_bin.156]